MDITTKTMHIPINKSLAQWLLIFLLHLGPGPAESRSHAKGKPYMIYDLKRTCLPYKKEINLSNGAAIFELDESIPSTR